MSRRQLRIAVYVTFGIVAIWAVWTTQSNNDQLHDQADQLQGQVHTNRTLIAKAARANHDNHELACRVGGFLVGAPIVKQPGVSQDQFVKLIGKAEGFLIALRRFDCESLGGVTAEEITKQLHALREAAPEAKPPSAPSDQSSRQPGDTSAAPSAPPVQTTAPDPSPPTTSPPPPPKPTTVTKPPAPPPAPPPSPPEPPSPPPSGHTVCLPALHKCIHVPVGVLKLVGI